MRRREFITLLGGAAALAAGGAGAAAGDAGDRLSQRPFADQFSVLSGRVPGRPRGRGLCRGPQLGDRVPLGGDQYERLPALAADLVRHQVAVIVATGVTASPLAAKAATAAIPIVFVTGGDPVKLGLVASLNRPSGNVTGATWLNNTMAAKRLELLREMVPGGGTIGLLVNPANPNAADERPTCKQRRAPSGTRCTSRMLNTDTETSIQPFPDLRECVRMRCSSPATRF